MTAAVFILYSCHHCRTAGVYRKKINTLRDVVLLENNELWRGYINSSPCFIH